MVGEREIARASAQAVGLEWENVQSVQVTVVDEDGRSASFCAGVDEADPRLDAKLAASGASALSYLALLADADRWEFIRRVGATVVETESWFPPTTRPFLETDTEWGENDGR
jgi:hypothetical protein